MGAEDRESTDLEQGIEEAEKHSNELDRPEANPTTSAIPPPSSSTTSTVNYKFHPAVYVWVLAKTTPLLDGLATVKMTGRIYLRAIVPIGFLFSLSLICGNKPYLTLSVAFIQMLKATTPVAVLITSWMMGLDKPSMRVLFNVSWIVIGVIIASYGEVMFVMSGFIWQMCGIVFEASRLNLVQKLLNSSEYKMDPLVSLYYFAPICFCFNFVIFLFTEASVLSLDDITRLGPIHLVTSAFVAFGLNVSVVFLIGRTSSLVLTLCGVLKDILLVILSRFLFGSRITWISTFGYGIALCGLVYYKLGADKIKEHYSRLRVEGPQMWQEYGQNYPARRKAAVAGLSLVLFIFILGSLRSGSSTQLSEAINAATNSRS